jgi:hypothetical protein
MNPGKSSNLLKRFEEHKKKLQETIIKGHIACAICLNQIENQTYEEVVSLKCSEEHIFH